MYVGDLITHERCRSGGFGRLLMDWLKKEGSALDCGEFHLDSGVQEEQAHRFYF